MIRPIHLIWAILVMGIGTALFLVSYTVEDREEELMALRREIRATSESIHVLRAEWSYLNDPTRLERLADAHLKLEPIKPEQYTSIALLADRPAAPPPTPETGDDPTAEQDMSPAIGDVPLANNEHQDKPETQDGGRTGTAAITASAPVPRLKPAPPPKRMVIAAASAPTRAPATTSKPTTLSRIVPPPPPALPPLPVAATGGDVATAGAPSPGPFQPSRPLDLAGGENLGGLR